MMFNISSYISNFFSVGHKRSIAAKKNIVASFIIKGLNIIVGLILVPMAINYLNPTKYGIWVTLSSVIAWFGFFDIGLGNGLRFRLAEALAKGEHILAKTYVSTTYAILSLLMAGILLLFYLINPLLNWGTILNAGNDISLQNELSTLALIIFIFFSLSFIFKLIATVLLADQQPAKAASFDLIGKTIALCLIFILTQTTEGSLLYLGIVMSSAPVLVMVLANVWFFSGKYSDYKPSIKYVDFSKVNDLMKLGINFFLIKIAVVLLYQTNNIIISHLFGPAQVTPYNVAFKYFSVLMMGFSIILTPFWSAFTEAWVKKEIEWIKRIMRKLIQIWGLILIMAGIMIIISPWVYRIWVGKEVSVPFIVSVLVASWVIVNTWNGIFSHFLNGIGRIRLQLYLGMGGAILNIPLAIFMGKQLGIVGVLTANIFAVSPGIILYFLQYRKLINNTARGIWEK